MVAKSMRRFPDFAALYPGCKLSTPRKFMCIGMPQQNARRLLRFVRAQRQKCAALSTAINIRAQLSLDATHFDATFAPVSYTHLTLPTILRV